MITERELAPCLDIEDNIAEGKPIWKQLKTMLSKPNLNPHVLGYMMQVRFGSGDRCPKAQRLLLEVAKHPNLAPDNYGYLCEHGSTKIRAEIAAKESIPFKVQERLAADSKYEVRMVLFKNPETPEDLRTLAVSPAIAAEQAALQAPTSAPELTEGIEVRLSEAALEECRIVESKIKQDPANWKPLERLTKSAHLSPSVISHLKEARFGEGDDCPKAQRLLLELAKHPRVALEDYGYFYEHGGEAVRLEIASKKGLDRTLKNKIPKDKSNKVKYAFAANPEITIAERNSILKEVMPTRPTPPESPTKQQFKLAA